MNKRDHLETKVSTWTDVWPQNVGIGKAGNEKTGAGLVIAASFMHKGLNTDSTHTKSPHLNSTTALTTPDFTKDNVNTLTLRQTVKDIIMHWRIYIPSVRRSILPPIDHKQLVGLKSCMPIVQCQCQSKNKLRNFLGKVISFPVRLVGTVDDPQLKQMNTKLQGKIEPLLSTMPVYSIIDNHTFLTQCDTDANIRSCMK